MMKRLVLLILAALLTAPAYAQTGADYDTLSEMAAEVTSSDFFFLFDASEADGSRMKKRAFDATATNCLNGAGGWSAFVGVESDPSVDTSGEIVAIIGAGVYETPWGTVTTRDADATPLVADHGIYSLTNTGALTVTDFVDADGDHTDFVAGDQIILILSDADITLDCSENVNLECFGGNDFTASATQITSHHFTFDGTRWVGPPVPMSSPTSIALAGIESATPTVGDPDSVTFTVAGAGLKSKKFIANAAGTFAHSEAVAVGENWVIEAQAAVAVAVTINAADTIMYNGTSCTQGVGLISDSTVAAFVACQYQAPSTITCRGTSFTCTP